MSQQQAAVKSSDSEKSDTSGASKSEVQASTNPIADNFAMQSLFRNQSTSGTPPEDNSSLHSLKNYLRTPAPSQNLFDARLHQNTRSDQVLNQFNTPGLTVGNQILVSQNLTGLSRERVVNHEMNHVRQAGGRTPANYENLKLGENGSTEELRAHSQRIAS